jgi:uncharacterized membrane protein
MDSARKTSARLLYLDWLRGIAALIMLQGHVFHSFLQPDLREGGAYVFSQFLGGMPPAIFLFLTGVTLAFLMFSGERKGASGGTRLLAALQRAGYLLAVAFLFRLQLWAFGWPYSAWTDLLKVDILNCMGVAIAVMAPVALFRNRDRVRLCAVLGLAIAAASPLVSQLNWSGVPSIVKDYIAPDYNHFSFFPWASYLAFGLSAGSLLRVVKADHLDRAMQWGALLGGAVIMAAHYFSTLPYSLYAKSEFWLDSPAQILIKLGIILVTLAFAYLWTEYGAGAGWSWVRQLGTASLLVYWVHIELVYGRWLYFWKEDLNVAQTTTAAVAIVLLMLLMASARSNWRQWRDSANAMRWYFFPSPDRVSGD